MNLRITQFLSYNLLLCLLIGSNLHGREDIIASLEDVIGKPPEKSKALKNYKRDTFYSVMRSNKNSEVERLIQQQQLGLQLTEEEQQLISNYQMGGNISGNNPVMRRIYPPVLSWLESNIKVSSGVRHRFIYCTPKADGPFPTALVLDPEIAQQFEAGKEEFSRVVRRMPIEAELPWEEPYRGRYITHSPIGNQLISHAISVIIPIHESLEKVEDISMEDWKSLLDFYSKRKELDEKSLFLVATKEYASLALQIAASYPFIGLMLEEPEQGIFGAQLPTETSDAKKMVELQEIYNASLENLTCPTLFFRHRNNPVIGMNDTLIFKPLLGWERPLHLSMTDYPLRSKEEADEDSEVSNEAVDPRFLYDVDAAKKITHRMLYFIQQNGEAHLSLLPEESTEPRSPNRATSLINQFEQMSQRLNDLTNSLPGEDNFDDSGGDDPQ